MGEFLKDNYFTGVRIILMLVLSIYGIAINDSYEWNTGVSVKVLLLVSLFISHSGDTIFVESSTYHVYFPFYYGIL